MAYDPEYHRQYYQRNKERKREQGREWAKRNPEKVKISARRMALKRKDKNREAGRRWDLANPEKALFRAAQQRAKKSNIPFDLELSDIIIPLECPLLHISLFRGAGRLQPNSPSLDKIIPKLGYVKGNIWVISWRANRMKSDASLDELIQFAHGILENFNGK